MRSLKVGFSRKHEGKPDAWAFSRPGRLARARRDLLHRGRIADRSARVLRGRRAARAEEDTNGDGRVDKWETYENGTLETVEFDENRDGRPDRRLTYANNQLATIESQPDQAGRYLKKEVGCTVSSSPVAIFVAGHHGLVGSAILRRLAQELTPMRS